MFKTVWVYVLITFSSLSNNLMNLFNSKVFLNLAIIIPSNCPVTSYTANKLSLNSFLSVKKATVPPFISKPIIAVNIYPSFSWSITGTNLSIIPDFVNLSTRLCTVPTETPNSLEI